MELKKREDIVRGSFLNNCYVISIYDNMQDHVLETVCQNTIRIAYEKNIDGVIFNFVNVSMMDTYTAGLFIDATKVISLMGMRVIWTGLNPGVVSSMVDFNIDMESIRISRDIQHGIALITAQNSETA